MVRPRVVPQQHWAAILGAVTDLDYQEIIALSEDPDVSFDDVRGQPFTPEEIDELAEFADSIFYQLSLDSQVRSVIGMPVDIRCGSCPACPTTNSQRY